MFSLVELTEPIALPPRPKVTFTLVTLKLASLGKADAKLSSARAFTDNPLNDLTATPLLKSTGFLPSRTVTSGAGILFTPNSLSPILLPLLETPKVTLADAGITVTIPLAAPLTLDHPLTVKLGLYVVPNAGTCTFNSLPQPRYNLETEAD